MPSTPSTRMPAILKCKKGKRLLLGVETSEKNYVDFTLEVKSSGGHSSRPVKDNAIYQPRGGIAASVTI